MRSFLRVSAAVLALLVATNVAGAQGGGGGGGGGGGMRGAGGRGQTGEAMSGRLLTDITLDEAQKTKLADAIKWYDAEFAKLPAMPARGGDGAPPPDTAAMNASRAARTKLTTEFQGKIKAFLTPDQATKFDANVAAAAQRGGGRRGGGE